MQYFVEYLRALRALRIAGIIMGLLLVLAVIARLSSHVDRPGSYFGNLEHSPTAHVAKTTLADGTVRTTIDDPARKIHGVSIVRGDRVHIEITQPAHSRRSQADNVSAGPVTIHDVTQSKGGMEHVVIDTDKGGSIPLGYVFLSSLIMGFIVASMLGGVLSKENDGHLELAWTKPVSRERYAVSAFAVDIVTIVASQLLWVVMALVSITLFFVPKFTFEADAQFHIAASFLAPIAWYAAITGWSASLKRGPGIVIGLGWLFASIVPGIAAATAGGSHPLVVAIHAVTQALTYLDPISYVGFHGGNLSINGTFVGSVRISLVLCCAALAALAIFYLLVALVQWRRVEA